MAEVLSSFQLPAAKELEVVIIRLADGTVVARTRAEVEALEVGEKKKG